MVRDIGRENRMRFVEKEIGTTIYRSKTRTIEMKVAQVSYLKPIRAGPTVNALQCETKHERRKKKQEKRWAS